MFHTKAETLLKAASLRVTQPRIAVLSVIDQSPHLDAASIVSSVRERLGTVSTQAVYDVLNTLVDAQLARRVRLPNGPARYERETGDNHQHVVCRGCGSIFDVEDPGTATPLAASSEHGFEIDNVEVTYWGLCRTCQVPE